MKKVLAGLQAFRVRESYLTVDYPFPTLYKAFYSSYEVEANKMSVPMVYLSSMKGTGGVLTLTIESDPDFYLNSFLTVEKINVFINNSDLEDDELDDYKARYIPIASCASGKALVVGIAEDNYDQIFLENPGLFEDDSRFKFLAKDIFQLLPRIQYWEKENAPYNIEGGYSSLYKNWGEDFWRVKGDDQG